MLAGSVVLSSQGCSGNGDAGFDEDDNRNEFIDGSGKAGPGSSGSGGPGCTPGESISCYSGPPETEGVGVCQAGSMTCLPDGSGFGDCQGDVLPSEERCATEGDDDCDGMTNEDGADCSCNPGESVDCYSGPPNTKGVGVCQAGSQTCNAEGSGYAACIGDITPSTEDCATPADEDCDGTTPACPNAVIDLRADNNRNGTIDLSDPSEDKNEASWSASNGAVFLANIDDDQLSCPTSGSDDQLAGCNDADDDQVNGSDDLLDLAKIQSVPWPDAPNDASAKLTVANPGASYVRLFKKSGANYSLYYPGQPVSLSELRNGASFAIEAKDILRDASKWDGYITVTWTVSGGTGPNGPVGNGSDSVEMRLAPVLFRHHLHEIDTYYVTKFSNYTPSVVFRQDMATAATAAGATVHNLYEQDQWTQDFFETAYMSMPKSGGGQHVIDVNFRSANFTGGSLRTAGKIVFTDLRGKDVAGAVEYASNHSDYMDTLNSFGNLETIPPYTYAGKSWPMGRVLRGSHPQYYPDPAFNKMIDAQGVQDMITIDTSWLLVSHVDETVSFIKANTPRGWAMMVNDAGLAKTMLQQQKNNGYGSKQMFVGKYWSNNAYAAVSISQVLSDPDVMNESAWAAVKIDDQVAIIKSKTGLTNSEIIDVPFLHYESSGYSLAYQPGTVNGIYFADKHFGSPDPHGPVINGQDIFKTQLKNVLSPYGITVHWIEDWDLYHRLSGEVHCGSNATRDVPNHDKWWESGL
jgi:protein-arginine deiminase